MEKRGKCKQYMSFLYVSNADCYTLFLELWFWDRNMEKNLKSINTNISSSNVYMGAVLWVVVQGQPMLLELEDVAYALSMKLDPMLRTIIPLSPWIGTNKS